MSYPAGQVELRGGLKVPVEVTDSGQWTASISGRLYSAGTKDELRTTLMRATARAKVKVAVQFAELVWPRWARDGDVPAVRHGTATGIHADNSNITVERGKQRGPGKDTEQIAGYGTYLRPLSPAEEDEWVRLAIERRVAGKALDDFESPRQINLASTVRKAIEAATNQAVAAEGGRG